MLAPASLRCLVAKIFRMRLPLIIRGRILKALAISWCNSRGTVKYMYFGQNWTELLQNELNYFHWILGFQVKYSAISLKVSCVIIMKSCIYLFMFKKYWTINKERRFFTSYLLDLLMLFSKWTNFARLHQYLLYHQFKFHGKKMN